MLRIHNTLSGKLEEFRPMVEGEAKFYYCGPTVWDYGHIGNFRSAIAADVLRRYLKFKGLRVTQVMNLTDVDDRIIATAPANAWTRTNTRRKTRATSLSGKPQTNPKNRPGTPASDAAGQVGISSAR